MTPRRGRRMILYGLAGGYLRALPADRPRDARLGRSAVPLIAYRGDTPTRFRTACAWALRAYELA
jgi:hypothetical protein